MIRTTWRRSTPCRMRSRSNNRAAPANSRCRSGIRRAGRRCATCCSCSATLPTAFARWPQEEVDPVRHLIGTATGGVAIPTRTQLPQRHAGKNDGTDRPHSPEGCARRWLLVDQRVQRTRLFRAEHSHAYYTQQPHREEGRRRLDHRPVRRLRRPDSRIACRSRRDGTTWCVSTVRERRYSTASSSFRRRSRRVEWIVRAKG